MKNQCIVHSPEEQKKGMREERRRTGKLESCNSHSFQWGDCLETRVVAGGHRESIHNLCLRYSLSAAI